MAKPPEPPLDCLARVITPENIEFEYALAGPFQRLPAFVFDFVLRALILLATLIGLGMLSAYVPLASNLVMLVVLLLFFFLSWFYGIYCETRFNGRTPGKMLFRLRVISVDGRPINATQATLRNLLRLADMCLMLPLQVFDTTAPAAFVIPTLLVGLITMTLSPRMQRVGDLAAGTMVISEHTRRSPRNLLPEDLRAYGLAELIPANFQATSSLAQTVGLYMENRQRLSPLRRQEVARHLAQPLIEQWELLPDTSPDLLLCALYVRIFLSAEQQQQGRQRMRSGDQPPVLPQPFPPVASDSLPATQVGPASPAPAGRTAAAEETSELAQGAETAGDSVLQQEDRKPWPN
ncbi:MAG: RDD family protein [Planctomycetales bacterium]|nr:RDD family protein [Planctomycetales bacterium]